MNVHTYHLLYENKQGLTVGLDEVQLLDPIPFDRVPQLIKVMRGDDPFTAYQAALILTAWGDDKGLSFLENMIDRRAHESYIFSPEKLDGYDNVYDEIAEAVDIYEIRIGNHENVIRIYSKLLSLYGPCDFKSHLKFSLLRCHVDDLLTDIRAAIDRALKLSKIYLASQLLPVIAKIDPEQGFELVPTFLNFSPYEQPNPAVNVAEALRYIPSYDSQALLQKLRLCPDHVVADEALQSLHYLSK